MNTCNAPGCNNKAKIRFCCNKCKDTFHNAANPRSRSAYRKIVALKARNKRSNRKIRALEEIEQKCRHNVRYLLAILKESGRYSIKSGGKKYC